MIINEIQEKETISVLIAIILFFVPFIVVAGFQVNQKLKEISWQELKKNESRYMEEISVCFDFLTEIEKGATRDVIYSLLKEVNDCLKSSSFVDSQNIAYLNLISLEETINKREIKEIDVDTRTAIVENIKELNASLVFNTRLGLIIQSILKAILLGVSFWLIFFAISNFGNLPTIN